jgi:hypothetical protein
MDIVRAESWGRSQHVGDDLAHELDSLLVGDVVDQPLAEQPGHHCAARARHSHADGRGELASLMWSIALLAIFAPLAVRLYKRRTTE